MKEKEAKELLKKYNAGNANEQERSVIEGWYVHSGFSAEAPGHDAVSSAKDKVWRNLAVGTAPRKLWPRIAAAASVLLILSVTGLLYQRHNSSSYPANGKNVIVPGHHQATLVLAGGQKIRLTQNLSGSLGVQGQTQINAKGQAGVSYAGSAPSSAIIYNELITGEGEQSPYPLVLSDGTKVWLNSASKLVFPVVFSGGERVVKLLGEGYFEISHDAKRPFKVLSGNQVTEDIGTKFNINAYPDEPVVTTTLLEGAVRLNDHQLMKPGDMAVLDKTGNIKLTTVEAVSAIAWKNGKFMFDKEDVRAVMRKLARWYNVEIIYEENIPYKTFTGSVGRFDDVSKILNKITFISGVHFKIDERRITVTN